MLHALWLRVTCDAAFRWRACCGKRLGTAGRTAVPAHFPTVSLPVFPPPALACGTASASVKADEDEGQEQSDDDEHKTEPSTSNGIAMRTKIILDRPDERTIKRNF